MKIGRGNCPKHEEANYEPITLTLYCPTLGMLRLLHRGADGDEPSVRD